MPRLILAIAIIAALVYITRRINRLPPKARKKAFVTLGLTLIALLVLFLTVTGRLHWIGAALTGVLVLLRQLLPLIIRFIPTWLSYRGFSIGSKSSKTSTVESRFIRMNLDHETGKMSGEVLSGEFEQWELDEMERLFCLRSSRKRLQVALMWLWVVISILRRASCTTLSLQSLR